MKNIIGMGNVKLNGYYFIINLGYFFSAGWRYCKKTYINHSNEPKYMVMQGSTTIKHMQDI